MGDVASAVPPPPHPRRRQPPVGASPGTLCIDPQAQPPQLHAFAYGAAGVVERRPTTAADAATLRAPGRILWLDVAGLGDEALLRELGERFGLHRLALEDITNSQQRAKAEDYPGHAFLVLRMVNPGPELDTEQWSLCLGDDFVLTFQERAGDCFGLVRQRLQDAGGRMRTLGPDYLAYALLDAVVDAFFPVLEATGDRLEHIEERILQAKAPQELIGELHAVRRDLLTLRRALWPLREVTAGLVRGDAPRFQTETRVYLRDVHDHVVQLLDLLENYRELGTSLMEVNLATASQRLNEVMKVLTVIATIFIPLTFIAGVYGMNFKHMPEYEWAFGYPLCLLAMAAIAGGMLWWFRRRGWL
jgi:magnesium transporter